MQRAFAHQNQNSLQSVAIKNKIRWLRISYWVGAILDGLYVIPMVVPQWASALFGAPNFPITPEIRYVFNVGAALMAGWTALLIWADRKPVERRAVLLLTLFPVKVGLDLASIALGLSGAVPLSRLLLSKIDSAGLWVLYIYSYLNTRDLVKGGRMNSRLMLLRIAYGWAIIADAASAVLMLFPNLFVRVMNIRLIPDTNLSFGLLYGVPLMICWTILLMWANQKPVERKAILLLTLPVVAGYVLIEIYAIGKGWATTLQMLPMFISQAGMSTLFIISTSVTNQPHAYNQPK